MDVGQFGIVASIVVVGSTHHQFRTLKLIAKRIVYLHGIVLLILHIIIVIVVVEEVYLGLQPVLLEGCGQFCHEGSLFLPRHVERGAVAGVEGLILRTDSIDVDALLLHGSDELHEILCIVLAIVGVQMSVCPGVMRLFAVDVCHLHPLRTSPGSSDDLHVRIDGKNLFQHRNHVLCLVCVKTEVLKSFFVTERIFCRREVIASDADTGIAHAIAFCL